MKFSSPIMLFIFASAGIHAGIVMTSNNASNITLPGSTGSVMEVKLEEKKYAIIKAENKENSQTKTKLKKKPKIQQNDIAKKIASSANAPENITQKKTEENKTEHNQEKQHAESRAQVISIIYKELKQRFTYPKLAVRRNWQGKVLLSLRVSPSGHIKKIQLAKSSGYSILDQAAINAISNIGNLPHTSTWLNGDIELKLPVIYKLSEG